MARTTTNGKTMNTPLSTTPNIDAALNAAVAQLNLGAEPDYEKVSSLDDWFGSGAEQFLRNYAASYRDQVALFLHDEPMCSIDGTSNVYRGEGFNIDWISSQGLQVLLLWSCGMYIDSAFIFVFGQGAGYKKPELKYSLGSPVEGAYADGPPVQKVPFAVPGVAALPCENTLVVAETPQQKALRAIVAARDHHAEHGTYPEGTVSGDQAFDDWAADLAQQALNG